MKVKTSYGEFKLIGYRDFESGGILIVKPKDGFAIFELPKEKNHNIPKYGKNGAEPKSSVLNWDELPSRIKNSDWDLLKGAGLDKKLDKW